jgi:hypothetical protein
MPGKDELIIPVKVVLKGKQTASGKLEKLKACIVTAVTWKNKE